MNARRIPAILLALITAGLIYGAITYRKGNPGSPAPAENTEQAAATAGTSSTSENPSNPNEKENPPMSAASAIDLNTDENGLSKSTVVLTTSQGVIKYKFYSKDAPKTAARMAELIQQGFYNGLSFHRVVPGFVIQGGDPLGNGTGGSGQKLAAEFNERRHIEGTVAMARAQDPNSADSQFYISLGRHPHLDRSYTVFGQVTEGMDVVKKIAIGDRMVSVKIE
jgi:cyclophilin family peptidyl-prolyl cis-trans isomerase